MLRKLTFVASLMLIVSGAYSQVIDPVAWNFRYEKQGEKQYDLIFTATIEKDWHIFSTEVYKDGPIPTSFRFDTVAGYRLDGDPVEVTKPVEVYDEGFGFKIKTFNNTAEFRQRVTALNPSFVVKGTLTFGSCQHNTCLPPKDVDFSFNIGEKHENKTIASDNSVSSTGNDNSGLLKFFLISLLAGLAGVLTPCVFPMIPMTVAFFSKDTEKRGKAIANALFFGISIILIYVSIGLIVSLTSAGAGFANTLSTHWIPNMVFFILFLVFAISFLGAFEIILPNSWVTKADSRVDKGGVLASFFMGLTTVIISFSCTGPIIGALLVEAARGEVLRPTLGMAGFGIAFAMPFTIFALFPSILSKLPKSGGWLNSIKVFLAFIMLAFSMKFLMNIDGVYSLGLLSRTTFLAIWIVLFTILGFYLLGKIKFRHDSDLKSIGTFRLFVVIAVFSFVLYLIPGLFGAPLTGISSFLPPQSASDFNLPKIIMENKTSGVRTDNSSPANQLCSEPKYGSIFEMPLGLSGYFDYNQALECAKERNKPLLIDFKGHTCANCKLMEAKVWSDPDVLSRLKGDFIIVELYVDDRTQLPENEWITSSLDGKVKKTIGKKYEDLEISMFKTNALPLYIIADKNGNPLNKPMPANFNVEEYKKWLDDGLKLFNQVNQK